MSAEHDSLPPQRQTVKDRFEELHNLVTGEEQKRLDKIEARLDDPDRLADEISNVLPHAVSITSKKSEKLVNAFTPVVEKSMRESIGKSASTFAHLLYPVIRPAIQKAIASSFKRMIQSFNKVIEHSFSLRGLRWRLESIITRKPFAEVVLLHSLVYSVDQVFLIHKVSGILLCQAQSVLGMSQDGDLVSSMLNAIKDFVQDSFKLRDEGLETIQVGDFSICIEEGEFVLVAGVVRGNAPESIRTVLKQTLDKVELQFREQVKNFNGKTEIFEKASYLLEPCLQTEMQEKKKRAPLLSWLLLLVLLGYSGYWLYTNIESRNRWSGFVAEVEGIPGVIVTEKGHKDGKYFIGGLRDPMSVDPMKNLGKFELDKREVSFHWRFYQALLPQYIRERANGILVPPATVKLEFKQGVLTATGRASSQWKKEAALLARSIGGVERFNQNSVTDLDEQDFHNLVEHLLQYRFLFNVGTDQMVPGQEEKLDAFVYEVRELLELATKLNKSIKIIIRGHTDQSGPDSLNEKIRIARSSALLGILKEKGISIEYLNAVSAPAIEGKKEEETDPLQRAVTFRATIDTKAYKIPAKNPDKTKSKMRKK